MITGRHNELTLSIRPIYKSRKFYKFKFKFLFIQLFIVIFNHSLERIQAIASLTSLAGAISRVSVFVKKAYLRNRAKLRGPREE